MAKVVVTPQAQKDLKKIPRHQEANIKKKLIILEKNPFAGKKLSGELKNFYSIRIWPYRAIYLIKKNKEIWVTHILHRQGVYK